MSAADPDPFEQSFVWAVAARALMTATALGVFDALAARPATPDELAERLELDPVGCEPLLVALRALEYLEADADGRYRPRPVAERLLVSSSPESIATFIGAFNEHQWEGLGGLDETLRTGRPGPWHARPAGDPLWAPYVRGLHELSAPEHDENAALVPAEDPATLLDVAGGHGGFAMAMCRRHPRLRATVLDLPASAAVGREIVAEQGFADRVGFEEGDVFEADLGTGLDVASVFNLVHHLPPEQNVELLRRLRGALRAGGFVVIGETERPEPGARVSRVGGLTGLLFYAMSRARTYTVAEMSAWLEQTGFGDVRVHRQERSPWRVVFVARA